MKKSTKQNLESLTKEVPVFNELEQKGVLGGTDNTNLTMVSVTDNFTGVVVPDLFEATGTPRCETTSPAVTSSTVACRATPPGAYPTTMVS